MLGDEPFDGAQRVGVQAGRDQPGVKGLALGGPAVVGAFGLVEGGVGAQRVEFVPGQLVAGGQPQRGVGGVAALEYSRSGCRRWPGRRGCRARAASAAAWAGTSPRGAAMVIASAAWRSAASRSPLARAYSARSARVSASSVR